MTDAELFVMIRDALAARRGTWSANAVWSIAGMFGVEGRRSDVLAAIAAACGKSGRRGGRVPVATGTATGTRTGTGTSCATGTAEKEKKQKKEIKIYTPGDASHLSAPYGFGEIEPQIAVFLDYEAEARGAEFTLAAARVAVAAIAKARKKHGDDFVCETLEKTIDKGAHIGYFNAVARNTVTGTRVVRANGHATGTGTDTNGRYQQPSQQQLELAERLRERSR